MTKQNLVYRYVDTSGNTIKVTIREAKFGWHVSVKKNGVENYETIKTGSLATILASFS